MRKIISTGMLILCLVTNLFSQETHVKDAEDLWGNKIDFDQIIHSPKTTVIQPFSSSNCGYCLLDGHFIEKNFFENNRLKNGINFTQCLFNPQLDVYAFIKHYRDTLTPVLTYPLELHNYHQDGYPAILAFRNGEQVVKLPEGSLFPYDSSFEQIKMNLWNDTSVRFQPVSDLQFATRIIYENRNNTAICAVQDGNSTDFDKNSKFASKAKCFRVKYLSMLTADDRSKNILYTGKYSRENYRYFCGNNSPFRMEGDSVFCFGPYRLGVDSIGVSACFPNPSNPEKYVVLMIQGSKVDKHLFDNSVDYTIFSYDQKTSSTRVLLHGFFDKKPSNRWLFSDSLCLSHIKASADCVRTCTQPDRKFLPEHPVKIAGPGFRKTALGEEYTFGNSACRFPSIAADNEGKVWICWEEKGDIMMSSVERHHPVCMAVESNGSDSYNPLIVSKNEKLWIFYLNNRDGFYRVYGRSFDGRALSEPVLYSRLLRQLSPPRTASFLPGPAGNQTSAFPFTVK
ncbi:MAG: hypothetical protein NTU44_13255 [Bacteroidetes bacterium]|nr:hypothetical protein [Bacteroidota bacterium]